jgi:hypothetical protein
MIYKLLLISIEYLTQLNIKKILSDTRVKIPTLCSRLRLEVGWKENATNSWSG